ncbi:MAG: response regulator, partial [Deltaproteobacteria bacterium]|nr:response regulator [Deltaproteobacteria bacterium]
MVALGTLAGGIAHDCYILEAEDGEMEMMTLHLLILEDNPDDAELAVKELERKGFNVKWTRVDTKEGFREALAKKTDLILVDYFVPSFDAMAALQMYRQLKLEIPLIVYSGKISEEMAVECMKSGATDYVFKDNLSRLCPVIKRALEEMKIYRKSRQAEEALRESEEKYRTLYDSSRDAIMLITADKVFLNGNPACVKMFRCRDEDEFISLTPTALSPEKQPDGDLSVEKSQKMISIAMEQGSHFFEWKHKRVDGEEFYATVLLARMKLYGKKILQATVRDITEHKKLEAQLRQSQKMQAIGILAGGVAHDFNNILTTIIGNAELALMNIIKDNSLRKGIKEIKKAGERAASLTRQLLAFSRKQIVQPKILDINELLADMEKMLRRLMQVLLNLAINARDAMPGGGKLTIETTNVCLNKNYFRERGIEGERSGHYVILAVSDTGLGMNKKTQEYIFDPFFTTKEVGKGTGLGLSTVYGIVKQNNGFVWVYSEPGQGSTFKVYLPELKKDADTEQKEQTPVDDPGGFETVLIVEDDNSLRNLAQNALQSYGYKILDAENGEAALKVCQEYDGQIDLMITDVVMPKMGGRKAAKWL